MENSFGKNIIPDNDVRRIEALRRYQILNSPPEHAFDNVAKLATQIFGVPISLISLVDADKVFFKANIGMGDEREIDRGDSLCSLAVMNTEVTVFENAPNEPCLMANPNVAGSLGLKFYAGAPLTTQDGFNIGTMCVIDKEPRIFSPKEKIILEGLAQIVMDEIELRLSSIHEAKRQNEMNEELAAMNEAAQVSNGDLIRYNVQLGNMQKELQIALETVTDSERRLKGSEENLKLLADNMSQLAWMTDETGYIFWYNKRWYDYTGTSLETMKGSGWKKVHHPDHVNGVARKFEDHILRGEIWEDTFPLRGADGEYRWFLSRAVPLRDEQEKIVRWVGTNTDITEDIKLAQQKDDFITIASHELKTPITSLKASLQLMDKLKINPNSPLFPKLIDQSNRSMEKLSNLVEDLLSAGSMSDGQLQLSKSSFTIMELLSTCCNHVRVAGIYDLVIEGDKDLQIYADEHRIDQVVVNFVSNAIKYAPGSKKIILSVIRNDDNAKISVTDSGPGIPKELQRHLFDRYWRADHSGSQYSGLGIGLYICSEIVKQHGGKIGVDSEPGKGSTFWFTIPMAQ